MSRGGTGSPHLRWRGRWPHRNPSSRFPDRVVSAGWCRLPTMMDFPAGFGAWPVVNCLDPPLCLLRFGDEGTGYPPVW